MEKEPFKNRTLGGRLVRDSVTTSVMSGFTCFMCTILTCMLLREIERGILSISEPPALVPYARLRSSLSSRVRVIAREVRVVLVRDTSAICKSNQTYVGFSMYFRKDMSTPESLCCWHEKRLAIYLRR